MSLSGKGLDLEDDIVEGVLCQLPHRSARLYLCPSSRFCSKKSSLVKSCNQYHYYDSWIWHPHLKTALRRLRRRTPLLHHLLDLSP